MLASIAFGLLAILIFALAILVRAASAFEDIRWGSSRFAYNLKRDLKWIIGFAVWIIVEVLFLLIILMTLA